MTNTTFKLLCEKCDIALKGPANSERSSIFTCDSCGLADTCEAFVAEASERVEYESKVLIQQQINKTFKARKSFKVTQQLSIPKKTFRVKFSSDPLGGLK